MATSGFLREIRPKTDVRLGARGKAVGAGIRVDLPRASGIL